MYWHLQNVLCLNSCVSCLCVYAAVIHPFAEIISYFVLFLMPVMMVTLTGTSSIVAVFGYITYVDFMNNLGHCNFELIPRKLFTIFPFLKYIMYTPTYVSLPSLISVNTYMDTSTWQFKACHPKVVFTWRECNEKEIKWIITNKIYRERRNVEEDSEQIWGNKSYFNKYCTENDEHRKWSIPSSKNVG